MKSETKKIEKFLIEQEPYYLPTSYEVEIFTEAYRNQLPLLLKGPTGCGKTRFMEYMAWRLKRPLITVACHDDLTSGDLVGRYLIRGNETVWMDGPLARAVKAGAFCYLDEIVEARKDTTVVIHPLADNRRILPVEKKGEILTAASEFHADPLLQSGLSKHHEGSQAQHQATFCIPGIRLSRMKRRNPPSCPGNPAWTTKRPGSWCD